MLTWNEESADGITRHVGKDEDGVPRYAILPGFNGYGYDVLEFTPTVRAQGLCSIDAAKSWCHLEMGLKVTLPEKLSDLLELAVGNMRVLFANCKYNYFPGDYHHHLGPYDDVCEISLAGAVIARTLGMPYTEYVTPDHYNIDINNRLVAIDTAVTGDWGTAIMLVSAEMEERGSVPSEVLDRLRDGYAAGRADEYWFEYHYVMPEVEKAIPILREFGL